jgi:general secretion pathway protein I
VLVALAIVLPALLLLYRQAAVALDLTGSSFATQQAISRAQSHLEALVDTALAPGDREGDDGSGYRWRTQVAPIATEPAPRDLPRRSAYLGGSTLYAVTVQISWRSARGPQQVVLETRRLGPAIADAP